MVTKVGKPVEPYKLAPDFERAVAVLTCSKPTFYGSVAHAFEVERFAIPAVQLLVRAAQAHAKDVGRGPSDVFVVAQRIHRWIGEGKVTVEEAGAAVDLLSEFEGEPDEASVTAELVPVMRRQMHTDTAMAALDAYRKGDGSFDNVEKLIHKTRTLGVQDRTTGSRLGAASFDRIERLKQGDRLATGILELDMGLTGGLPRGKTGLFCAPSKAGKSQFLISQSSFAIQQGLFVVLATLSDLDEEDQEARLIANLTGYPIDAVTDGTQRIAIEARLQAMLPQLGAFVVKFFPAKLTTFRDVADWIKEAESEEGKKIDLCVVDYIDELGVDDKRLVSEYQVQGQAMRDMRLYVRERGIWGWTAAQPKRREVKERTKRIEIDDIADSMKKGRIADLIITCNRPSESEVEIYVAGNRHGKDKFGVGPMPHQFECARFVPIVE